MKILVTGGTGLVGSALKADIKVGSEFDLRITKNAHSLISIHKPTHIIHCAARVGGLGGNMNYKGEFYYDNIMINTNIIEAARLGGIKKLVCFLSTCIFPDKIDYPLTEAKIHLGEPHSSNYPYAYAKRMADIQIKAYREQYGLDYKCVIPTNIYGSNDIYLNFNISGSTHNTCTVVGCFIGTGHKYASAHT
jgi:GDP-L-fucose synthase